MYLLIKRGWRGLRRFIVWHWETTPKEYHQDLCSAGLLLSVSVSKITDLHLVHHSLSRKPFPRAASTKTVQPKKRSYPQHRPINSPDSCHHQASWALSKKSSPSKATRWNFISRGQVDPLPLRRFPINSGDLGRNIWPRSSSSPSHIGKLFSPSVGVRAACLGARCRPRVPVKNNL